MIPIRGFDGDRVAVFGLGRTGLTAARALKAGGAVPVLWDENGKARESAPAEGFEVEDLSAADWSRFAALREHVSLPIYAIGGLAPDDIPEARRHGAQGIAAIRSLWPATPAG